MSHQHENATMKMKQSRTSESCRLTNFAHILHVLFEIQTRGGLQAEMDQESSKGKSLVNSMPPRTPNPHKPAFLLRLIIHFVKTVYFKYLPCHSYLH